MKIAIPAFVLCATILMAQTDTFQLTVTQPSPYTPTYIGNGNLGVATSPLGTVPAQSFMAGLYDAADGDVPRIAALPAWNEFNVFNGRTWLNDVQPGPDTLRGYRQTLNMYQGSFRSEYDWTDGDRVTPVLMEMFTSRSNSDLAAVKLEITPRYSGPVRIILSLRGWKSPARLALARLEKVDAKYTQQDMWYPGHMIVDRPGVQADQRSGRLQMISHPEGVNSTVAEVAELTWPADLAGVTVKQQASGDLAFLEIGFEAVAGKTYTFHKLVTFARSPTVSDALERAGKIAGAARSRGYDALLKDSAEAWRRLWETDIVVDADPKFQTLVHSMIFYLLASAREGLDCSIGPMGLATAGYYGHYFWDADTFMFPSLMVLHPEMAKPIVMFRYRTLEAAKANARKNGWKGAMYPWEAGPDGSEATPRFAWQNATSEIHVNAAVALAQWQYYLATGDREWLAKYGYPVIKETADFWVSRVTYNKADDRYEIHNVVSWIESLVGVDNDAYTNAAAAKNLDLAVAAAKIAGETPNAKWEKISRKLYLPEGAEHQISYLLGRPISNDARRKHLEDSIKQYRSGEFSVMMGITFDPILAVEAKSPKLLNEVFPFTYKPYLMPAFNVLREAPSNENINFLTGAGGFLQQFLFGYTGLRFSDEGLTRRYDPLLPSRIRKLTLKNITARGTKRDVVIGE